VDSFTLHRAPSLIHQMSNQGPNGDPIRLNVAATCSFALVLTFMTFAVAKIA
jgi:hypothetical protein